MQLVNTATTGVGLSNPNGWPLAYAAPAFGLAAAVLFLWVASGRVAFASIRDRWRLGMIAEPLHRTPFRVDGGQGFLIFFGVMLLIDIIDELRRFSDKGVGMGQAIELALMNVPSSLYRILPLIMILSAIAMFLGLARSSELVVVRASGRSGLRFLVPPVLAALAIGVVAVAVLNPFVAATLKQYDALWYKYARGTESVLSISDDGLWLRQGGEQGPDRDPCRPANADGTELFGATFLSFDANGAPLTGSRRKRPV